MLEIKITLEATGLENALTRVADALQHNAAPIPSVTFTPAQPPAALPTANNTVPFVPPANVAPTAPAPTVSVPVASAPAVSGPVAPAPVAAAATLVPEAPNPAPVSASPAAPAAPAAPKVTREQIAVAGASLVDKGLMNQLISLLNQFGVQAITQLADDQLEPMAAALRTLGAQI